MMLRRRQIPCVAQTVDRTSDQQKHPVPACNRVFLWSQQKAISYFQYTHTKNSPCTAIQKDGRENGCPVLLRAVNRTRQLHVSDRNARFSRGGNTLVMLPCLNELDL